MDRSLKSRAKRAKWDLRLAKIVNRLDCNPDFGWGKIMEYATAHECMGTYARLCIAFGPGARKNSNVLFVRNRKVLAFLSPEERVRVFSLVSSEAKVGASGLKRSADFANRQLVLAPGSIALDRVEAASIRFPALEDVSVNLGYALSHHNGFTDASRAPILAKLCTFTFVTKLVLFYNDIAVVPDAANASIGALTNLKYLHLEGNKIATLPASIGRLTALETLDLTYNILTTVPASIGSLTALTTLDLCYNRIATLPDWICVMTALTTLDLDGNQLAGLPDTIGQLTGLETLYLGNNQLTALPESIVALTNLTYLNLVNNPSLIRSAQSAAVQAWLQALEDSPACNYPYDEDDDAW